MWRLARCLAVADGAPQLDKRALDADARSLDPCREAAVKLFRRSPQPDPDSFDARRAHPFIDRGHAATAGIAVSHFSGSGETGVMDFAGTGHVMRTSGCAVPGCGKPAADEIHGPAEE
jgi:hypothetical protein